MKLKFRWDPSLQCKEKNFFTKILVLGEDGVGKSTLVQMLSTDGQDMTKRLKSGKHKTMAMQAQKGIDQARINVKKWGVMVTEANFQGVLEYSFWDFVGQDICRTAHRFFLSKRTIYIVAMDLQRSDDMSRVAYWLSSIRSLNRNAVILLVGTHADKMSSSQISTILQNYATTFPFLTGVYASSKTYNPSLQRLREQIIRHTLFMEHIGKDLPSEIINLVAKLPIALSTTGTSNIHQIMQLNDFVSWIKTSCSQHISSPKNTAQLLSDLDFIVFPPRGDAVILNRQWIVTLISHILTKGKQHIVNGKIHYKSLPQVFDCKIYSAESYTQILALLRAFDILYSVRSARPKTSKGGRAGHFQDDSSFFVPCLFGNKPAPPLDFLWENEINSTPKYSLGRAYVFHFLPPAFFERLQVRLHALSKSNNAVSYRNAVTLSKKNDLSLVRYDPTNYILRVTSAGNSDKLFLWILDLVDQLLCTSYRPLLREVFCVCTHCLSEKSLRDFPTLFSYEAVVECFLGSNPFLECTKKGVEKIKYTDIAPDFDVAKWGTEIVPYDELNVKKEIGRGAYGTVYKGSWRGASVAIKVMDMESTEEGGEHIALRFSEFRRETKILGRTEHPCAVRLLALSASPFAVVMEYLSHGDLCAYINQATQPLSLSIILKIGFNIAQGLAAIHNLNPPVVHRDMKSPNILLVDPHGSQPVMAKICDFGLSTRYSVIFDDTKVVDNPRWCANEVLVAGEYSTASDTYAFAVTMSELLTRILPFHDSGIDFMSQLEEAIVDGLRPVLPLQTPRPLRNVIEQCWNATPDLRPSMTKVANMFAKMLADEADGKLEGASEWQSLISSESIPQLPLSVPRIDITISAAPSTPIATLPSPIGVPDSNQIMLDWEQDVKLNDQPVRRGTFKTLKKQQSNLNVAAFSSEHAVKDFFQQQEIGIEQQVGHVVMSEQGKKASNKRTSVLLPSKQARQRPVTMNLMGSPFDGLSADELQSLSSQEVEAIAGNLSDDLKSSQGSETLDTAKLEQTCNGSSEECGDAVAAYASTDSTTINLQQLQEKVEKEVEHVKIQVQQANSEDIAQFCKAMEKLSTVNRFRSFLRRIHSSDGLDFWREAQQLQSIDPTNVRLILSNAQRLNRQFISPRSAQAIDIPEELAEDVALVIEDTTWDALPLRKIIADIQKIILNSLIPHYKRFEAAPGTISEHSSTASLAAPVSNQPPTMRSKLVTSLAKITRSGGKSSGSSGDTSSHRSNLSSSSSKIEVKPECSSKDRPTTPVDRPVSPRTPTAISGATEQSASSPSDASSSAGASPENDMTISVPPLRKRTGSNCPTLKVALKISSQPTFVAEMEKATETYNQTKDPIQVLGTSLEEPTTPTQERRRTHKRTKSDGSSLKNSTDTPALGETPPVVSSGVATTSDTRKKSNSGSTISAKSAKRAKSSDRFGALRRGKSFQQPESALTKEEESSSDNK